jgi:hypothetical protein
LATATRQPQTSIYEQELSNPELEAALEQREKRKASASAVQAKYKEADDEAKALIAQLDLGDGTVVRCGRFLIARTAMAGRQVSFETEPSSRLQIRLISEE